LLGLRMYAWIDDVPHSPELFVGILGSFICIRDDVLVLKKFSVGNNAVAKN
jgi:hypothetical protein